jgi:hypothetical protein
METGSDFLPLNGRVRMVRTVHQFRFGNSEKSVGGAPL